MGEMQLGSGSEWHLLRMLGRHRQFLNATILDQIRRDGAAVADDIKWLDFPSNPKTRLGDGEHLAVDFLGSDAQRQWKDFWPDPHSDVPNRHGQISWDAVGLAGSEWILVEAKANEAEFNRNTPCGAQGESLKRIKCAFAQLRRHLRIANGEAVPDVWLTDFYQLANRLACLYFVRHEILQDARLVLLHFAGDRARPRSHRICPETADRWHELMAAAVEQLGLQARHPLSPYVHHVVLDLEARSLPSVMARTQVPKNGE